MTDNGFDQFLADALRPPDRDEDQQFARQVIKRIGIEQQLRKQRSAIVQRFASDLIALLSVSAALVAVSRAPALREIGAEQISTLLATVLLGLGAWIWISSSAAPTIRSRAFNLRAKASLLPTGRERFLNERQTTAQ